MLKELYVFSVLFVLISLPIILAISFFSKKIFAKELTDISYKKLLAAVTLFSYIITISALDTSFEFEFFDVPVTPLIYLLSIIFIIKFLTRTESNRTKTIIISLIFLVTSILSVISLNFVMNEVPSIIYIPLYPLILTRI